MKVGGGGGILSMDISFIIKHNDFSWNDLLGPFQKLLEVVGPCKAVLHYHVHVKFASHFVSDRTL